MFQLFATSWTAAHQVSLPVTISQSLLKLTSVESVVLSNHLILCRLLLLLPSISPSIRIFSNENGFPQIRENYNHLQNETYRPYLFLFGCITGLSWKTSWPKWNASHFQGCRESPASETRRNWCLPGRVQARAILLPLPFHEWRPRGYAGQLWAQDQIRQRGKIPKPEDGVPSRTHSAAQLASGL